MTNLNLTNELDWIKEAKKHIGVKEIVGIKHNSTIQSWLKFLGAWWVDDETAWCGTFIAFCLKSCGIAIPKNWFRALDYSKGGTLLAKPCYGCVAIKERKGGGHVTFVVGKFSDGTLACLGGNQNNQVSIARYKMSDFKEFRWYGRSANPKSFRYDLPVVNSHGTIATSES